MGEHGRCMNSMNVSCHSCFPGFAVDSNLVLAILERLSSCEVILPLSDLIIIIINFFFFFFSCAPRGRRAWFRLEIGSQRVERQGNDSPVFHGTGIL